MAGAVKDVFYRIREEPKDDGRSLKKSLWCCDQRGQRVARAGVAASQSYSIQSSCKGLVTEKMLTDCYGPGRTIAVGVTIGMF